MRRWHICLTCPKSVAGRHSTGLSKVKIVTSDDRVADIIEKSIEISKNEKLDVLVSQMSAASEEYIEWAKKQTKPTNDGKGYYDRDAFENTTAIAEERIASMKDM